MVTVEAKPASVDVYEHLESGGRTVEYSPVPGDRKPLTSADRLDGGKVEVVAEELDAVLEASGELVLDGRRFPVHRLGDEALVRAVPNWLGSDEQEACASCIGDIDVSSRVSAEGVVDRSELVGRDHSPSLLWTCEVLDQGVSALDLDNRHLGVVGRGGGRGAISSE